MSNLLPIFDHQQIELFRHRALRRGEETADFLLRFAAIELQKRLELVSRSFDSALDLHSYNNLAQEALLATNKVKNIIRVETGVQFLSGAINPLVAQREDYSKLPSSLDLIVSLLSMQLINDLPSFLKMLLQRLEEDGLLLACCLGSATLLELRTSFMEAEMELSGGVSARIAPFASLLSIGDLLHKTGFSMPVVDSETLVVYYKNIDALIGDLRSWGMQNALLQRNKCPVSKQLLQKMQEIYLQKFRRSDGAIAASFELIWISAWSPHESHQKPAARGSAKVSLAKALAESFS